MHLSKSFKKFIKIASKMDTFSHNPPRPVSTSTKTQKLPLQYNPLLTPQNPQTLTLLQSHATLIPDIKADPGVSSAVDLEREWTQRWNTLAPGTPAPPLPSSTCLSLLHHLTSVPSRSYHTLYHYGKLFEEWSRYLSSTKKVTEVDLNQKLIIFLCIWFHDAVYDP